MCNSIIIKETYKRNRTKCGAWSKKTYDHERTIWSEQQFANGTEAGWKRFFGAREERTYTAIGYVPCRWTYVDPEGVGRIDTFEVIYFNNLGYRERFALDNTTGIDLVEEGGYELARVHYCNEDGEHRSVTLNITNRCIAA